MLRTLLTTAALSLAAAVLLHAPIAAAQTPQPPTCSPGVKLQFICGVINPEDLVQVPGTSWIIASGLINATKPGSGGLTLVDAAARTAAKVEIKAGAARAPFKACPGPLDFKTFSAHGLNIRPAGRNRATLYVVSHGAREAIEVFDVVTTGRAAPTITWAGCVPEPQGARFNSVTALADGRVIGTDYTHAPMTQADAIAGRNTGAVYVWKPGGAEFTKLAGTELPGANGVEATPDGKYLLVAVTGTSSIMRYELAATQNAPKVLKTEFRTDNIRWGPGGKLLLAGPAPDASCPPAPARCPQSPAVGLLDPNTMEVTRLLTTPAEPAFQGLSSALIVDGVLWLGSYNTDRIAYTPLPH